MDIIPLIKIKNKKIIDLKIENIIDSSGKILLGGKSNYPGDFSIARYNNDGSLDTSFGTDGKVITDISGNNDYNGNSLVIDLNGKILVGGSYNATIRSDKDEAYDDFNVAWYPSLENFQKMNNAEEFRKKSIHRGVGLKNTLTCATTPYEDYS